MKHGFFASVGAWMLCCAAYADGTAWFDARIGEYASWPSDNSDYRVLDADKNLVGTWSNTAGASLDGLPPNAALEVSASSATPLTFTAADATARVRDTVTTFASTVEFTPFDELPELSGPCKGGVAMLKGGHFWVIAKSGEVNGWVDSGIDATSDAVQVLITVQRTTDNTHFEVIYKIGDHDALSPRPIVIDDEATMASLSCTGDGVLSELSATRDDHLVTFTISTAADIRSVEVRVGGKVATALGEGRYQGVVGQPLVVTYTAAGNKIFANGTQCYTYPADGVIVPVVEGATFDTGIAQQTLRDAAVRAVGYDLDATDPTVAHTNLYLTLGEALSKLDLGIGCDKSTLTLLMDEQSAGYAFAGEGHDVTLDLGGFSLSVTNAAAEPASCAFLVASGTLLMRNGTLDGTALTGETAAPAMLVSGGDVTLTEGLTVKAAETCIATNGPAAVCVMGGRYTDEASAKSFLAPGCRAHLEGGYWVVECYNEAQIGKTQYATLAEALAAVSSGGTVKLIRDVTTATALTNATACTLDLNGKTLWVATNAAFVASADIAFVNGMVPSGALVLSGAFVANAKVDLSVLTCGAGGLAITNGWMAVKNGGEIVVPSDWRNLSANALLATHPGLFVDMEKGGRVTTSKTYTWNGTAFTIANEVARATTATGPDSFDCVQTAVDVAQSGTTVSLVADVALGERVTVAKSLTLDLGAKTVRPTAGCVCGTAFHITAGAVTIRNGAIDSTGITDDDVAAGRCYAVMVGAGASLCLPNGLAIRVDSASGACVYAAKDGFAEISGGTYANVTTLPYPGREDWMARVVDQADVAEGVVDTQLIVISGGTFTGQDPADGDDSGSCATFIKTGYYSEVGAAANIHTVKKYRSPADTFTIHRGAGVTGYTITISSLRADPEAESDDAWLTIVAQPQEGIAIPAWTWDGEVVASGNTATTVLTNDVALTVSVTDAGAIEIPDDPTDPQYEPAQQKAKDAIVENVDLAPGETTESPTYIARQQSVGERVDTLEQSGVNASAAARYFEKPGVCSADVAASDYIVASVELDSPVVITEESDIEVSEYTHDPTEPAFKLTIQNEGMSEAETIKAAKAALEDYVKVGGDLDAINGDVEVQGVDADGTVRIAPYGANGRGFLRVVIPQDNK